MEVFIGTIQPFAFDFAPRDWALCAGQTLPLNQYQALFSLLGTIYGGNGVQNFMLPNLQGRMPIGQGNGAGLTARVIGEVSGTESVTATLINLPTHTHATTSLNATTSVQLAITASNPVTTPSATNAFIGASGGGPGSASIYSDQQGATPVALQGVSTAVTGGAISPAGQGQPMATMNPYLAINFSIALNGIFPSRG
ncbi:phage tail protein [Pseudomonas sp. 2822-15]|uniref:Microcystin-dependent protein n=1 Tax=Pseudomonas salomonii TaxID=191391 RepID=A0A1H3V377_9PSED|nr:MULTISPECIES: tail fiber protein [Pseudomonas]NWF10495.1 phage tail protein [Pseudomonas salomonii]PIB40739.1 phage tail protein [Pseudomonas sp. 2822-15]CRM75471.1 Phage Tail Collar Domain protein [Pseudomonas sp. 58 R 3]SDZ69160.1 Microcystin-dependent protein [Pseudomonas salomonii]